MQNAEKEKAARDGGNCEAETAEERATTEKQCERQRAKRHSSNHATQTQKGSG